MKKHACPSCGATLGLPDEHERVFKCSFCGSVLEDQAASPSVPIDKRSTPQIIVSIGTLDTRSLPTYAAPGRSRIGVILLSMIVLIGGGIAAAVFALSGVPDALTDAIGSGGGGLDGTSLSSGTVLAGDGEDGADAMVVVRDGSSAVMHYVDLGAEDPTRWHETLGVESAIFDEYLSTPETAYAVVADRLFAWDRATGDRRFAVTLSDVIQANVCVDCVQMFDGMLVTLTVDGVIAGYDPSDGTTRWSVPLVNAPRQLVNFGGRPAVLDDVDNGGPALKVFEVANGALATAVPLDCGGGHRAGIYDYLLPLPDGGFFWEGTDIIASCAQRFGPGATAPAWSSPLPDGGVAVDNDASIFTVVGDRAVVVHDSEVNWYSLADGARSTTVLDNEDVEILGQGDGRLYVRGASTRGTTKWTIHGLDPTIAQVVWSHEPGSDYLAGFSTMTVTTDGWLTETIPGGLVVITNDDADKSIRLQVLAAADGTATDTVTVDLGDYGQIVWPSFLGTEDGQLVMAASTTILVVDPVSGKIVTEAP